MKQNQYEITYLVDATLNEEDRGSLQSSVDELITSLEGSVRASSPTLRKKLAYEIKRKNAGFMRVMNVEVAPEKIADIQDFLKRSAGVMRFTILATPERARATQELLDKYARKGGKGAENKEVAKKQAKPEAPAKEVTMKDVEKGIEEALTEEVQ